MANLSNINNKFIVQDNSRILVNKTSDTGATLQVGGSLSTDTSVRVGNGVLYVGDGANTVARIMGYGDYEMISGVSGATYLYVSGSGTLAGALQDGQYILAAGLAYGAVNNYTQIINGSTGAITGTSASFIGTAASGAALVTIENNSGSTATSYGLLVKGGGGSASGKTFEVRDDSGNTDLIVKGNGDVGIGTDDPNAKLEIKQGMKAGTTAAFTDPHLRLAASNTVDNTGFVGMTFATSTADNYGFSWGALRTTSALGGMHLRYHANSASGTDIFSIDYVGNVTIPSTRFIRSNSSAGYLIIQGGATYPGGRVEMYGGSNAAAGIIFSTGAATTSPTERLRLLHDGQFWIKLLSTTSGHEASMYNDNDKLQIFGSRYGGTGKYVSIWSDGANENTRFYPTKTVFYKNVGIGTDTPNSALQVNQNSSTPIIVHRPNNTNFDPHGIGFSTRSDALNGGLGDVRSGIFSDYNGDLFLAAATSSITTSPLTYSRIFIEGGNGNVGIGTTNPQNKFVVANGTDNTQNIEIAPNYIQSFNRQSGNLGYASLDFYANRYGFNAGYVGIGMQPLNYQLEIGGVSDPVVAIVSNTNTAPCSLYFGDSDAKDRGQIKYNHSGDFMEIKAGGGTRLYLESGINTAYTADGLFNSNATPSYWNHGNGQFKLGYMDNGSGLYSGAYCFNVKSTDGIPVTGREIGAIFINDVSNGRRPLRISNQGRITIDQTNTSTNYGSGTGWLTIANGTGAYNFYNAYTGTDGGSGCARYRLNNTSPSFFDFYYTTTQVGYITTNGTDIFYANTSDYRLKEDLKSFDGMSLLEQIQVYDFKWKESDNRMYGVVAHELQEVVPQAVVGDKDQEKLQAVDYSKLVPILIKSIQELKAEIELLKNN